MERNMGPARFIQSRRLMKGYLLRLRAETFLLGSYSAVKRNTRIAMGLSALFSIVKVAFSDRDSVTPGVSSRCFSPVCIVPLPERISKTAAPGRLVLSVFCPGPISRSRTSTCVPAPSDAWKSVRAAKPFASFENGLAARTLFQASDGAGTQVEVRDLLIGPGQKRSEEH